MKNVYANQTIDASHLVKKLSTVQTLKILKRTFLFMINKLLLMILINFQA